VSSGGQPAESGYVVAVLVVGTAGLLSAVCGWALVPPVRPARHLEPDRGPLVVES
jgi:hypothetical protein